MQPLSEMIGEDNIVLDLKVGDFESCLERLAGLLADRVEAAPGLESSLQSELRQREDLGVTAIGGGVAIPHAYLDELPRQSILFVRLQQPLPHDAPDGEPVDLIFLLTGPRADQARHLPLLARLVRLLHDTDLRGQLRHAASPEEVRSALADVEKRHA